MPPPQTEAIAPGARGNQLAPLQATAEGTVLLLLGAGFLALASTGRLPAAIIAAGVSAFLARGFLWWRGITPHIPARWQWAVLVLYVPVYILDAVQPAGRTTPDLVGATLHLAVFAGLLKLFSFDSIRDQVMLGLLAFLEVLAAGVLSEALTFLAAMLVFLALVVAACVVHEVARAHLDAGGGSVTPPRGLGASLLRFSLGLSVGVVAVGTVIFFLLPRATPASWQPRGSAEALTGFSDEVALGEVANLQQSDSVVMHIHIAAERPAMEAEAVSRILWRGRGLTYFDGKRWVALSRPTVFESHPGLWPRGGGGGRRNARATQLLQYQVTLEPLDSQVLFFPARMLEAATPFFRLGWDAQTDTLEGVGSGFTGTSYSGLSDIARPTDGELRELPPILPRQAAHYTQLPEDLDPRVRSLARTIVADTPENNFDRMQALTNYLRSNYSYSIQDLPQGADPLANFLFQQRAGSCEYFASALAVMARTLAIPTRVVNGFTTGTYNPITGNYVVRGRNAHSWVEAFFPLASGETGFRSGTWVSFDATPPGDGSAQGAWGEAEFVRDAAASLWEEWVVKFDAGRQTTLARAAESGLRAQLERAGAAWKARTGAMAAGAAEMFATLRVGGGRARWPEGALLLLGLGGAGAVAWRRRGGGSGTKGMREAGRLYGRFEHTLARAGCAVSAAQTAPELLAQWVQRSPPAPAVEPAADFVAAYERVRYDESATADLARLRRALGQLRAALRAGQPTG